MQMWYSGAAPLARLSFGRQSVSVTMDQLPLLALAAENLRNAQVERDRVCAPFQACGCPLETDPVSDAVARRHLQNLEATVAGHKACGVAFIYRVDVIWALLVTSLRTAEGRGRDDTPPRSRFSAHKGSRRLFAPLQQSLEIPQVLARSTSCLHSHLLSYMF